MGKPKQAKNKATVDSDLLGDDSWVMVKKQRVTILIPSLTHARTSSIQKPDGSTPLKLQNERPTASIDTNTRLPEPDDEQQRMTIPSPDRGIQMLRVHPADQHRSLLRKSPPPRLNVTMEFKSFGPAPRAFKCSSNVLGASKITKTIKPPQLLPGPGGFLDGRTLLNQRLRATLLERKLQKAGGLSRWLASLGLGQFERIFQGKCVNKFQLANLSMKKLKDMGADAVGPRRKLIHAIDCICQPYCFKTC
ncbi:hypothetical protein Tsubulata_027193 [Turnera subulata]|uniref:SAM domain-containing protein n=1 Tax=Turnera subulata TaxID=218843 RepID=A0A9Q0FP92_9ROSI|nr:hypothetical protein Tsubulata_027193 [Turnera subulata]